MADWENEAQGASDGYNWGASGPSNASAPVDEQNDFGNDDAEAPRENTCRK
jgi:hypothetical protein